MKIEITPSIVIPDMMPLIHLAAVDQLGLLNEMGRVVIMDIVAYEATFDENLPWAQEVAAWLAAGQQPGANRAIEIVKTEMGEAYRLARKADATFKMENAGERAIRDWLVDTLPEVEGPALVVYEDKKLPRLIEREDLSKTVVVATTRAVLNFAEECGLIESAEQTWTRIIAVSPGANPSVKVQVIQPVTLP